LIERERAGHGEDLLIVVPLRPAHGLFAKIVLYLDARHEKWCEWQFNPPEGLMDERLAKVLSRLGPST
jgi:hypothetical protein